MSITTKVALADLLLTTCACGKAKPSRKSHCSGCYFKLPKPLRQALYKRLGSGYEEAYEASLQFLNLESPTVKAQRKQEGGDEAQTCENCDAPATTHDPEGVPLCAECAAFL